MVKSSTEKVLEQELFDLKERLSMTEPGDENHAALQKLIELKQNQIDKRNLIGVTLLSKSGLGDIEYVAKLPVQLSKAKVHLKDMVALQLNGYLVLGVVSSLTPKNDEDVLEIVYVPHEEDALMNAVRRMALQQGKSPILSEVAR